jgi:hypothetical protein
MSHGTDVISEEQVQHLNVLAQAEGLREDDVQWLLRHYNLASVRDIPPTLYPEIVGEGSVPDMDMGSSNLLRINEIRALASRSETPPNIRLSGRTRTG